LETFGRPVPARYVMCCFVSNVCSQSKNYLIGCASAADVVCRDIDVF
jgi:hypothetical protein